jgi:hypothetical protein
VLGEHLVELVEHADAGVDDQALLTRAGGDHIAVGAEGLRLEAGDEHDRPSQVFSGVGTTGTNRNDPSPAGAHHFLRRYPYTLAGV